MAEGKKFAAKVELHTTGAGAAGAREVGIRDAEVCGVDEFRAQVVQLDRGYPLVEVCAGQGGATNTNCSEQNPARLVTNTHSGNQNPPRLRCEFSADMRNKNCVVGDYVRVRVPHKHDNGVILEVEPRDREFVRKDPSDKAIPQVLAANFDTVFILQPITDVNLSRLQRELVVAHQSRAKVVVLLSKSDLANCDCGTHDKDPANTLAIVQELAGTGVEVFAISTKDEVSINRVRSLVPKGTLAVLVGCSGAGKSSLINALVGKDARETGEVRARDGRGRHTTVNRSIVNIAGGGRVVDMPGVRGLGVWEAKAGLRAAFPDIAQLASACKFRDCTHMREPGCAVRAALVAGEISKVRLDAYLALLAEEETQQTRNRKRLQNAGIKKSDRKRTHRQHRKRL